MRYVVLFSIVLFGSLNLRGQTTEDSVKMVITNLFSAMANADSSGVAESFAPESILHTIGIDRLRKDTYLSFASSIARLKKGQLDERIRFEAVHVDGNLASVWTPYRLYFDGKFMHCGANSFQLVKMNGQWRIAHLIDTRRKDCN